MDNRDLEKRILRYLAQVWAKDPNRFVPISELRAACYNFSGKERERDHSYSIFFYRDKVLIKDLSSSTDDKPISIDLIDFSDGSYRIYGNVNLPKQLANVIDDLQYRKLICIYLRGCRITQAGLDTVKHYSSSSGDIVIYIFFIVFLIIFGFLVTQSYNEESSTNINQTELETNQMLIEPIYTNSLSGETHFSINIASIFFENLPDSLKFRDVVFPFSRNLLSIETESSNSSNPPKIVLNIEKNHVVKVHFFINLTQATVDGSEADIFGQEVAQIKLIFRNRPTLYYSIKAGKNIRDWLIGKPGTINTYDDPGIQEIFRDHQIGTGIDAVIDHVLIPIPPEFLSEQLESIIIEDFSFQNLGSLDPGLIIFGGFIEKSE